MNFKNRGNNQFKQSKIINEIFGLSISMDCEIELHCQTNFFIIWYLNTIYSGVRVIASRILHGICLLIGELAIRGTKLTLTTKLGCVSLLYTCMSVWPDCIIKYLISNTDLVHPLTMERWPTDLLLTYLAIKRTRRVTSALPWDQE